MCIKCDKRHTPAPPKRHIRHNVYLGTNGDRNHHATAAALSASGGGAVTIIAPPPAPSPGAIGSRTKLCKRCAERGDPAVKLWHQFYRDTSSPDGLGDICKECLQKEFTVTPTPMTADGQNELRQLKCYRCSTKAGHDVFYAEDQFYTSSSSKTGRQSYCIQCMKDADRARRNRLAGRVEEPDVPQQQVATGETTKLELIPAEEQPLREEAVLAVPEAVPMASLDAVRVETRQVTMVPAFARAGNMILNLSNVAFMDDTDPNKIEVVLNIHDIGKDGTQHPRTFVVRDQDAYALRTALIAIMGNDEQIQRMAQLIKKVEDAARNETTALELAANAEQQAKSFKAMTDAKDADIARLQAMLDAQIELRERAEEEKKRADERLDAVNKALGR